MGDALRYLVFILFSYLLNGAVFAESGLVSKEAKVFATPDRFSLPSISPSGRYIAMLETGDIPEIVIYDFDDPDNPSEVLRTVGHVIDGKPIPHDYYVRLRWLTDTKLFIDVVNHSSLRVCGDRVCRNDAIRRFNVLDLEKKTLSSPFAREFPYRLSFNRRSVMRSQVSVVSWPDSTQGSLLLSFFHGPKGYYGEPGVYEVDPDTLETKLVVKPKKSFSRWFADNEGQVRFAYERRRNEISFRYRLQGQQNWKRSKRLRITEDESFSFIGQSEEPNRIYVFSNRGADKLGVYLYDLETDDFERLVAGDDDHDVDVVRLNQDGSLRSVSAGGKILIIDDKTKAAIDALGEVVNDLTFAPQGRSSDGTKVVYEVTSSSNPGTFYLYDQTSQDIFEIAERRPRPDWVEYSYKETIELEARDGLPLQAYVALPRAVDYQDNLKLPFVVLPHGGPWSRDYDSYDELTQFINALGIGVIKVNFRGSSGFGLEFQELGYGQWGRAMQDDLNDARAWLVQEGLADPEQICMVGWSYGGYASLMAAVRDSDKYACAGSIAGVTDLVELIRTEATDEVIERVGASGRYDRRAVLDISPVQRAEQVQIPVFLAHGQFDAVVPAHSHYAPMLDALLKYEKDVDYVAFAGGDHSLSRSEDRQILYTRLGAFLESHLLATP
ncbi:MAG: prolyl oligopeptidase family serine peptidase [Pseudomonadota bacterium]